MAEAAGGIVEGATTAVIVVDGTVDGIVISAGFRADFPPKHRFTAWMRPLPTVSPGPRNRISSHLSRLSFPVNRFRNIARTAIKP